MTNISSFIYEFGKAGFLKRNDNSCLRTREICWQNIENFILKKIAYPYIYKKNLF